LTDEHLPITQSIVGNVFSLGSGELLARAVAFAGTAYLARMLGPTGFGIVGFALVITGYLSVSVKAGIDSVGAREVAKRPTEASHLAASVMKIRLLIAPIALLVLGLIAWFLPKPETVKLVVFLSGLSFFTLALDTAWVHKGLENSRRVAVAMVLTQAIYVALLFALVQKSEDVIIVPVALVVGQFIAAIFLALPFYRNRSFSGSLLEGWYVFRNSSSLILTKLLRGLLYSFDILLLGFLIGEREVGLYIAPYRVCHLLIAFSAAVLFSYLPEFTRAAKTGPRQVSDVMSRSLEFSWALSIPLVAGGILVAKPLLEILFGSFYGEGARAFQLLLLSVGLIFVRDTVHNVLLAYDRLRTETQIAAAAVVVNISLNFLLIPKYGLVGAATATVTAEALILVLGFWVIRGLGCWPKFAPLAKVLAAVGIMSFVVHMTADYLPLLVRIGVGAITYGLTLILVRGIPRDAFPLVQRVFPFIRL